MRLGIVFVLFTVCRILFYAFNYSFFGAVSPLVFFYGLRFDIASIAMIFIPFSVLHLIPLPFRTYTLYQKGLKILFHLINSIALLLNCIDFEYFKFTFKRTTSDVFDLVVFGNDFITLLPQFLMDYWYVCVIWLLLIIISELLYRKTFNKKFVNHAVASISYYPIQVVLFIICSGLIIMAARGGMQLRPINIIHAGTHVPARNIPLVLNTPFTIIKTIENQRIEEMNYFNNKELELIYSPVHNNSMFHASGFKYPVSSPKNSLGNIQPSGTEKYLEKKKEHMNIVIIILESFSNEYIGSLRHPIDSSQEIISYTPFLDELIKKGLVFDNCFANGKKSIEAIPAIVASIPTLMNNPYISSAYSGNEIKGMPSILKEMGYTTSFFHGGTNGTMGFDAFAKTAGFEQYFGRHEYNNDNDYDGKWGIYDEPFFQFFAQQLNQTQSPFFSCIFSLSSHHPYSIPDKYRGKFVKGKHEIHQTIQYTDYALQRFFETAYRMPWFDNTLFVITADHTGNALEPFYKTSVGMYAIPLLLYKQNSDLIGVNHTVTQQTDIMPSILDYINYNGSYIAFGNNVFKKAGIAVNYLNNIYQIINDEYVLQFDGEESISLYNYRQDDLLKNNIINSQQDVANKIERELKAIIQSYNYRLINNRLVVN